MPPPNDNWAAAITLTGRSGTIRGSTVGGSLEPGEPEYWGEFYGGDGPSIWYKLVGSGDFFVLDCLGSDFILSMSFHTGNTLDAMDDNWVNYNDNWTTAGGRFVTRLLVGTTYYLRIAGFNDSVESGDVVLNWTTEVSVSEDNWAAARAIHTKLLPGGVEWGEFYGDTSGATKEPGEPNDIVFATETYASMWHKWVPRTSGPAQLTVTGFGWGPEVAIYTNGTSASNPGDLVDASGTNDSFDVLNFTAEAGRTYWIVVLGADPTFYSEIQGEFVLYVEIGASGNSFSNPTVLSGCSGSTTASLLSSADDGGGTDMFPHYGGEAGLWFRWQAPMTGRLQFHVGRPDGVFAYNADVTLVVVHMPAGAVGPAAAEYMLGLEDWSYAEFYSAESGEEVEGHVDVVAGEWYHMGIASGSWEAGNIIELAWTMVRKFNFEESPSWVGCDDGNLYAPVLLQNWDVPFDSGSRMVVWGGNDPLDVALWNHHAIMEFQNYGVVGDDGTAYVWGWGGVSDALWRSRNFELLDGMGFNTDYETLTFVPELFGIAPQATYFAFHDGHIWLPDGYLYDLDDGFDLIKLSTDGEIVGYWNHDVGPTQVTFVDDYALWVYDGVHGVTVDRVNLVTGQREEEIFVMPDRLAGAGEIFYADGHVMLLGDTRRGGEKRDWSDLDSFSGHWTANNQRVYLQRWTYPDWTLVTDLVFLPLGRQAYDAWPYATFEPNGTKVWMADGEPDIETFNNYNNTVMSLRRPMVNDAGLPRPYEYAASAMGFQLDTRTVNPAVGGSAYDGNYSNILSGDNATFTSSIGSWVATGGITLAHNASGGRSGGALQATYTTTGTISLGGIPVTPGEWYHARGWVTRISGTITPPFRFVFKDGAGVTIESTADVGVAAVTTEWREFVTTPVQAPILAATVTLEFTGDFLTGPAVLLFDDITFTADRPWGFGGPVEKQYLSSDDQVFTSSIGTWGLESGGATFARVTSAGALSPHRGPAMLEVTNTLSGGFTQQWLRVGNYPVTENYYTYFNVWVARPPGTPTFSAIVQGQFLRGDDIDVYDEFTAVTLTSPDTWYRLRASMSSTLASEETRMFLLWSTPSAWSPGMKLYVSDASIRYSYLDTAAVMAEGCVEPMFEVLAQDVVNFTESPQVLLIPVDSLEDDFRDCGGDLRILGREQRVRAVGD